MNSLVNKWNKFETKHNNKLDNSYKYIITDGMSNAQINYKNHCKYIHLGN